MLSAVVGVAAQEVVDPPSMPVRVGPFGFVPSIGVVDMGFDGNVFNTVSSPKSDFTATVQPALETWFRAGRTRARVRSGASLIYFQQFDSQQAVNLSQDALFGVQWLRLTPFVGASYANTRDRPSLEIYTRVRRTLTAIHGGVGITLSPRLVWRTEVGRQNTDFADDAIFETASLQARLNETAIAVTSSLRYDVTPLTRLVVLVQPSRDMFPLTPTRNARSRRIAGGVEFAPTALISGSASVGVRTFDVQEARVADFTGLVTSLDLAYLFRDHTRFAFRAERDVAYSYEVMLPYYVQSGIGVTVSRRVRRAVEVSASANGQRLDYRGTRHLSIAEVSTDEEPELVKRATDYGVGVSFGLSRRARLGLHVERATRPARLRSEARSIRVFTTVTYGM
jgi:hypothetical protein